MPAQPIDQPPLIAMRGITKAFPGVLANDQIDLEIYHRRDPCLARGKRRRKKHADEDPVRFLSCRRG